MSPAYTPEYVLPILERAIAERNDGNSSGGAARVAVELETSDSLISQLRAGTYPKPEKRWYPLIIETYGNETVDCPELGEITLAECSGHRKRGPTTDSYYARMYRACKGCKHNNKGGH
jgi:hypothetical protein